MKKLYTYRHFCLLVVLFYALSCQEPNDLTQEAVPKIQNHAEYDKNVVDESIAGLYEVRAGILHFKDLKSYKEMCEKLRNLKPEEKYNYWKNDNFLSYEDEFTNAILRLSKATTDEEYSEILSENQDIIVLENKAPRPKAGSRFVNHFINRAGLVYIGKILYKFDKYQQKIAFDGSLITIQKSEKSAALDVFNNVITNTKNAKTLGTCTSFYKLVENGSGNRRVTALSETTNGMYYVSTAYGADWYTVWWNFRVKAIPEKKNIWGNWVQYNATNTLYIPSSTVYLTTGTNSPFPCSFGNPQYTNEWHEITYDRYFEYPVSATPLILLPSNTVHHFEEGPLDYMGSYSGSGVSLFYFGCGFVA